MKIIREKVFEVSQAAMAEIAGVNQATVSRWETGLAEPDRPAQRRIREYARRQGLKWSDRWFFEAAA